MPDLENAACILFWGYNPSLARLAHATATVAALRRGARLIVVDPRRTGLASKADVWLRVRPGSDGALALGVANIMIERGWYDRAFVRDWTNGPLLVRSDNGRLLTEYDLSPQGSPRKYVAWAAAAQPPLPYASTGSFDARAGNGPFPGVLAATAAADELLSAEQLARALGRLERPLGPSRWGWVTTDDVYRAVLEQRPYAVRGLVGFGANLL